MGRNTNKRQRYRWMARIVVMLAIPITVAAPQAGASHPDLPAPSVAVVPPPTCLTAPRMLAELSTDGTYRGADRSGYGNADWAASWLNSAWRLDHCIFTGTGYDPIHDGPLETGASVSVAGNQFHTGVNTLTVTAVDGYQHKRFRIVNSGTPTTDVIEVQRDLYPDLAGNGYPTAPLGAPLLSHLVPLDFAQNGVEVGRISIVNEAACRHDPAASGSSCTYTVTIPDGTPAFVGFIHFVVREGRVVRPPGTENYDLSEVIDPTNLWTPAEIPSVAFAISYDGSALQSFDISDVRINPAQPTVNDALISGTITLRNSTTDTLTDVSAAVTSNTPGIVTISSAPSPATVLTLAPGASTTLAFTMQPVAAGPASIGVSATATRGAGTVNAQPRTRTFDIGDPGLKVTLVGTDVELGRSFAVRMTVTNTGTEDVSGLNWGDPTGLTIVPGDNPPLPLANVLDRTGPDHALPNTIGAHQTVVMVYGFNAPGIGTSVILAHVTGTTVTSQTAVSGDSAVSVFVVGQWSEAQRDQLAVAGINASLGVLAHQLQAQDAQFGTQLRTGIGFAEPTAAQVTSLLQSGLSNPGLLETVAGTAGAGRDQAVALLTGWARGMARGADKFGVSGGQVLNNIYNAISDPDQRQQTALAIWEYAKTVPASAWTNFGYLGQALAEPYTSQGLLNIYHDQTALAGHVLTAVGEAAVGTPTLLSNWASQYVSNPVKALDGAGDVLGESSFTGFEAGAVAVIGEVGMAGIGTAGSAALSKVLPNGLRIFSRGGAVDAAAADTVDVATAGASDARATESMVLRHQQAQQVMDSYQALPVGTTLDATTLVGKGGMLDTDARAIQAAIGEANQQFRTTFRVATRTSEPLSAGLDGIAKPEFIKPKAVSVLDQMIGADPARAGKVSLFEPKPLDPTVVAELDKANPGFAAKYADRLETQQKLWNDWQNPNSPLRKLTEAGEAYKDKGGITVLNARPGNPIPYGMQYLEQLDEAAFQAANGINPADVPALKQQILTRSNIDTFKAAPIARISETGAVYLDEALSGKAFISDLDIQSVAPVNGVYPPGVTRGQVETFFKAKFQNLERFPFHGWSDAAPDLPSSYYIAAIPFQLGNADPALAVQAANLVAGRLQSLENIAIAKAARLTAAGDPTGAAKVLAPFQKLTEFKDPNTGLYSSSSLLKEFPPGEKTINFTAGDVRVGYGTGGH